MSTRWLNHECWVAPRTKYSHTHHNNVILPLPVVVVVTRARRTRRRRAGTPRARGTRPAAAARARATPGTCGTRRAATRTPRGPARRRPRPASREKRDALTHHSGRCDRTATPSFCTPAASKQAKNLCEGFSQPLGARGKPSGSVSSASLLEAIKINRALVDGSNDE